MLDVLLHTSKPVNQALDRTKQWIEYAAILGHAAPERTRILPERYRKQVIFSAEVWPTFLVDGFVAGRWSINARPKEAVVELKPFRKLTRAERAALEPEAEALARFYYPEAPTHGVRA